MAPYLPLNTIVSKFACNSPSLHVPYLGPKIITNIFCNFYLDVTIYMGHALALISAIGVTILPLNTIVSQSACNSPSFHVLYISVQKLSKIYLVILVCCQNIYGTFLTLSSSLGVTIHYHEM